VEVGALEVQKAEMDAKRREIFSRAEEVVGMEIRNLEDHVYLDARLQEVSRRVAEMGGMSGGSIMEVCSVGVQSDMTGDNIRETELELVANKKKLEVDVMLLAERIKAKEKEYKLNYGEIINYLNR
jgi:hypothetical protein